MKPKNFFLKSFLVLLLMVFSSQAYAVTYDLKEDTPAIKSAIAGRQSRYSQLVTLKASGAVGEDNQGYVKALSPETGALVEAENADRRIIYHAIVDQNKLGPGGLEQVQIAFAEVQLHKARNGDSVQLPTGEWTKK